MNKQQLLTAQQAADYLSISIRTLANHRSSGRTKLPFIKLGRAVRYSQVDLDNYLSLHTFSQVER